MKNNVFKSPIASKSVVDRIIDEITSAIIDGSLKPEIKYLQKWSFANLFRLAETL